MILLIEIAGWLGAILILLSYILVSVGRLQGQSVAFQLLNLVGALGFIINTGWHGAIPSMTLNIIWCGISLWTLAMLWRTRARS